MWKEEGTKWNEYLRRFERGEIRKPKFDTVIVHLSNFLGSNRKL